MVGAPVDPQKNSQIEHITKIRTPWGSVVKCCPAPGLRWTAYHVRPMAWRFFKDDPNSGCALGSSSLATSFGSGWRFCLLLCFRVWQGVPPEECATLPSARCLAHGSCSLRLIASGSAACIWQPHFHARNSRCSQGPHAPQGLGGWWICLGLYWIDWDLHYLHHLHHLHHALDLTNINGISYHAFVQHGDVYSNQTTVKNGVF